MSGLAARGEVSVSIHQRVLFAAMLLGGLGGCAYSGGGMAPDQPTKAAHGACASKIAPPLSRGECEARLGAPTALEGEAAAADAFERARIVQLCAAREADPCDAALAFALESAFAERGDPARKVVASSDPEDPARTGPSDVLSGEPAPVAQRLERYPRVISPSRVAVGQRATVLVGLAMNPSAASAATLVVEGETGAAGGTLAFELPPLPPDVSVWKIDVILTAPAFEVAAGQDMKTIDLPRYGDSTLARFDLRLVQDPGTDDAWIGAYLFHDGAMIGQIGRKVVVDDAPSGTTVIDNGGGGQVAMRPAGSAHELHLIAYDAQHAMVVVSEPGKQPSYSFVAFDSGALGAFLGPKWGQIRTASRGIDPSNPIADPKAALLVRGLGTQLWDLVPPPIREHLLRVWSTPSADSLRIYTNVPEFPWELVQPTAQDGTVLDPLGARFRIGRWHLPMGPVPRNVPPDRLPFDELVAVVPSYAGAQALPALQRERAALQKVSGFRELKARLDSINSLVKEPPEGIVHFAGHGIAAVNPGASTSYAIRLEDGDLDALAFRGMPENHLSTSHTLVFFNACEVGQSSTAAGLVEGWAPALLDAGASGYIGALWPVSDGEAADFAASFYGEVEKSIGGTGEARVTDVLRCLRQRGTAKQDPTWQAYVFYGDPDTVLYRDTPKKTGKPYTCGK